MLMNATSTDVGLSMNSSTQVSFRISLSSSSDSLTRVSEVPTYLERPPEPYAADYVEMVMLTVLFILGAPLNLAACTQLSEKGVHSRLDILKRHLNYTDLLVMFVFVPSRVIWLITYDWRGGDLLCKLVKFAHTFAFQSSSNVIVCIALDRLLSVLLSSHQSPLKAHHRTKSMLAGAWLLAALSSLPQLAVWSDYLAIKHANWSQCMQIWDVAREEAARIGQTEPSMFYRNVYSLVHIVSVFWLPSFCILTSYFIVLTWVYLNSKPSVTGHMRGLPRVSINTTGCETMEKFMTKADPRIIMTKTFDDSAGDTQPLQEASIVSMSPMPPVSPMPPNLPKYSRQSNFLAATSGAHYGNSQSYQARLTRSRAINLTEPSRSRAINLTEPSRSRAIRVSLLLVAAYLVCWLPYNLVSLLQIIHAEWSQTLSSTSYWLHALVVFNSVLNPYLYGLFGDIFQPERS